MSNKKKKKTYQERVENPYNQNAGPTSKLTGSGGLGASGNLLVGPAFCL